MDLKYGVQSARTGRFKLAKVQDLNDSYEMRGACVGRLKPKVQLELIDEITKQYYAAPNKNEKGLLKRDFNLVLDDIKNSSEQTMKIVLMRRETYEERQRVLCFTDASIIDNNADLLLWGHYADNGRGVRVLVNIPNNYIVEKVKYSEQRPVLDLAQFDSWMDVDVMAPFFMESVFTKGLGWAYEHEVRLVTSSEADGVICANGLEFVDFGVSSVHCIDFGPMARKKDVEPVIAEFQNSEVLKHIRFRIATFHEFRYQYDYVDYGVR